MTLTLNLLTSKSIRSWSTNLQSQRRVISLIIYHTSLLTSKLKEVIYLFWPTILYSLRRPQCSIVIDRTSFLHLVSETIDPLTSTSKGAICLLLVTNLPTKFEESWPNSSLLIDYTKFELPTWAKKYTTLSLTNFIHRLANLSFRIYSESETMAK